MKIIDSLLKDVAELKPMPKVATQIMKLIEDPNTSMGDLADVIKFDPLLTASILKVCNSAAYGLPNQVESVQDAISFVGIDQILDIVLLKCGSENLKNGQQGYGLNEGDLWRYAVSSAIIAKDIAGMKNLKSKHMIYTAALLKDIGKVVLDRFVGDSFAKINSLVENNDLSFREAEKKVIGVDHAELGGIIAKQWKFSPQMVRIIMNHHLPTEASKKSVDTSIVYLADTVCMMMGVGVGFDGLAYRFHKDVLKKLNISQKDLQKLIAGFGEKMQKIDELMDV